jgi:mono/diheme cytochrome c family protein
MKSFPISSPAHILSLLLLFVLIASGCYYDNEEDLYPVQPGDALACDTVDVSYAGFVQPLMEQQCTSCHSGSFPSGNIALATYEQVVAQANNGKLYGSMAHLDGYSQMPKSGNKLPDCDLDKLKSWIDAGASQN